MLPIYIVVSAKRHEPVRRADWSRQTAIETPPLPDRAGPLDSRSLPVVTCRMAYPPLPSLGRSIGEFGAVRNAWAELAFPGVRGRLVPSWLPV